MANARFLKSFRFNVGIEGATGISAFTLGFQEVTGFDATYDIIEYRDGADTFITPAKFSGLIKYSNITLSRGMATADTEQDFWKWMEERLSSAGATSSFSTESAAGGAGAKMTITLNDDAGSPAASWEVRDVWPTKYTGPDLKGNASELAIEKIEIAHRGIFRLASAIDAAGAGDTAAATS